MVWSAVASERSSSVIWVLRKALVPIELTAAPTLRVPVTAFPFLKFAGIWYKLVQVSAPVLATKHTWVEVWYEKAGFSFASSLAWLLSSRQSVSSDEPGGESMSECFQWLATSASQCLRSQTTPCRLRRRRNRRRRSSQSTGSSQHRNHPRSTRSSRPGPCTRPPWWAGTDPWRPPAPRHAHGA
eukprot:scaffold28431_cov83-Phaeocystis_antarctica.AAC.2